MVIKEKTKKITNINCMKTIYVSQQKEPLNMPITNWKTGIEQVHKYKYLGNALKEKCQCETEIRSSL